MRENPPRLLLLHLPIQMIIPLVLKLQERHQSDTLIGSIVIDPDCDVPSITMGMLGYLMINVLDTMLNILEDKLVMADFFLQDGLEFGKCCQSIEAVLGLFQTFLNLRNQASVEYDAFWNAMLAIGCKWGLNRTVRFEPLPTLSITYPMHHTH